MPVFVLADGYSHSIMITASCRAGHVEEAKKLARDYEASYNKYDVVILNVLLCAYCRAGDMDFVMQTLRKMDKLGINPDQYTFRILIKYFCKEKLYLLAYRTLQDMRIKGHQLEEVNFLYHASKITYCRADDIELTIFGLLLTRRLYIAWRLYKMLSLCEVENCGANVSCTSQKD